MTKKRYLAVAGMLTGIVCLGAIVPALLPPRPGVTKANFDRIQEGMTILEVEEILGERSYAFRLPENSKQLIAWWWKNPETGAGIEFEGDVVAKKNWTDLTETFAEKLRRWLHLDTPVPLGNMAPIPRP